MQHYSISPKEMVCSFWCHRWLLLSLIKQEIAGRYKGSTLGLFWSFVTPLFMLAVYTFAFGVVFQARWGALEESTWAFAVVLFAGLMVFNLFAECLNRSPSLVLDNVNYVKKVIFPLEILPAVVLGSALFHMGISVLVWFVFHLFLFGLPPVTILLLPFVLLPLVLFSLGCSWFLTSIGVYIRDVGHVIGILTTALLFLSAIFYPIEALPEGYRSLLLLNPLVSVIHEVREVMMFGGYPHPLTWLVMIFGGAVTAWLGFAWFQKTRKGFADVL